MIGSIKTASSSRISRTIIKNLLKIKYQTFRTKRVSADSPYENEYIIVRKGDLATIDHHKMEDLL